MRYVCIIHQKVELPDGADTLPQMWRSPSLGHIAQIASTELLRNGSRMRLVRTCSDRFRRRGS